MLTLINRFMLRFLAMLTPVLLLAACGGGGSGPDNLVGTPDTPTTSASLQISLSATATSLNSGEQTILTATVTDTAGQPLDTREVSFSFGSNLSTATLSATSASTDANGKANVRYTAGSLGGSDNIIANVTDANGKVASASVAISVNANTPPETCTNKFFTGSGARVLPNFTGISGPTTFVMSYNGSGNFIVHLNDSTGATVAYLANEIGSITNREQSVPLEASKTYFIAVVEGSGSWSISVTNPSCVTDTTSVVGSVRILTSSNTIGTNETTTPTTVIVEVKDQNNRLLPEIAVALAADKGSLAIPSLTTDATGTITAQLTTGGLYENGDITLNASASGVNALPVQVNVQGTTLTLSDAGSAVVGGTVTYSVQLKDSGERAIRSQRVAVSTTSGKLSASELTTDVNGVASFTLTVADNAKVTAQAFGVTATRDLKVSTIGRLEISTPLEADPIKIGTSTFVRAKLTPPLKDKWITFATTRGVLTPNTAKTDAAGEAVVSISSTNSGNATITAELERVVAQRNVVFTAPTAEKIVFSADPTVVSVNGTVQLVAILRDNNDNTVAGQQVSFRIVTDTSGGTLSAATATTDANGRASVNFVAGATATAPNGVEIEAKSVTNPSLPPATQQLTVAAQSLFVRIGSSNISIDDSDPRFYKQTYTVIVTDSAGLPVKSANLSTKLLPPLSDAFRKGTWEKVDTSTPPDSVDSWRESVSASCNNEDINQNGILDAGEDTNNNGQLDPGNIATIEGGDTATTDDTGFATLVVKYAQNYGIWVNEVLTVTARVVGSEGLAETRFTLPVPAARLPYPANLIAPSANPSPWGSSTSCSDVL